MPLPAEDGVRYTAVPNADLSQGLWEEAGFSARGVAMSATETLTSNERVLGADPMVVYRPAKGTPGSDDYEPEQPGGIGEEDMVTLVLPYARSARDGVRILGELLERYGTYEMNGIAFSDVNEIWWLETVGGHHWIAKRVPDDCYVTMPNQLGIDSFDLADALGEQTEHMCSPDLAEWMAAHHLDLTLRAEGENDRVFNPRDAFGSHSDEDHLYNTPRAWSMQRFLNPHAQSWDSPEAPMGPEANDLPWASVPERKVTIEDVKYVLSLHYQGTAYDPYGSFGTEATRCVQWLAFGSNPFNALLPFYASVSQTPAYLEQTDPKRVSTESFYWANRLIAAMADANYAECVPAIEAYQLDLGSEGERMLAATDALVAKQGLGAEAAQDLLEEANQHVADYAREKTDELLAKVLYERSMHMANRFARSDA